MANKFSIKKLAAGVLALLMVVTALPVSGITASVSKAADAESDSTPVYVLYDANRGEHFFTANASEKDNLLAIGWKEGNVAWMSPKTSNTPVYVLYNPNDGGDHYYTANASEKDSLLAIGWKEGDVKFYSDDAKGVLINTLYNPNEIARNHHYTKSSVEKSSLLAAGWQDHTNAATAIYGVDENSLITESAVLIDESGLQTDGTGLTGDTLRVTYTAELGNPSQVTWYRDGTAVKTLTAGSATGLTFTYTDTTDPGTYYATITTGDGQNFTSNRIKLTNDEKALVMSDFTITDYTDEFAGTATTSTYQTFAAADKTAIVTVTFSKKYTGTTLYAYPTTAASYDTANATQTWTLDQNTSDGKATGTGSGKDVYTKVTSRSRLTDKAALDDGDGIYYVDSDGSVTYKLVTFTTGLTRGSSYKLVVDQAGLSEDNPSAANKNVNMTDSAVAPYLPAPAAIAAVDILGSGANGTPIAAAVEVYSDEKMENPMGFLGSSAVGFEGTETPTVADEVGGLKIALYVATGTEAKDGAAMSYPTGTTKTSLKLGKSNAYTYTGTGAQTGVYAVVKTTAGIYGPKSVTLTSALAGLPAQSVSSITTSYSKKTPNDIKVSFTGLKTAGRVYVVRAYDPAGTATTDAMVQKALTGLDPTDSTTYVGYADVAKSTASVVVEDCVDKLYTGAGKADAYGAVFIPANMTDFGVAMTTVNADNNFATGTDTYCAVTSQATTYKVSGTVEKLKGATGAGSGTGTEATGTTLEAYDQFGDIMTGAFPAITKAAMTEFVGVSGQSADNRTTSNAFSIAVAATGVPTLYDAVATAIGDVYKYKIEDGAYIVLTCTTSGTAGNAEFTISISDK